MGECYFDGEEEVGWVLRMVGKARFDISGKNIYQIGGCSDIGVARARHEAAAYFLRAVKAFSRGYMSLAIEARTKIHCTLSRHTYVNAFRPSPYNTNHYIYSLKPPQNPNSKHIKNYKR